MERANPDTIGLEEAKTLHGLFRLRLERTPERCAYRHYDQQAQQWCDTSWAEMGRDVAACQAALDQLDLEVGERVAIMAGNCREWVVFEQAALGLGLVVVPLYANDRPESVAYILRDCGARLLLIEGQHHWDALQACGLSQAPDLVVWSIDPVSDEAVAPLAELLWARQAELRSADVDSHALATIVYTSGTTGKPKGVMLSHHNILWNADAGIRAVPVFGSDLFLSFLPLSHTLERTIGYYLPMMTGATVAYARSIPQLAEDLQTLRPTILISVPRIYERSYNRIRESLTKPAAKWLFEKTVSVGWQRFEIDQGRASWSASQLLWPLLKRLVADKVLAKLGGRLRIAICGGAPLPAKVGKVFVALGLNLLQGYGMTEASPVIAVNRPENNDPASVGPPLPDVQLMIGDQDELLANSPGVMMGYWNNPEATAATIDEMGWLHTGDKARLEEGRVYITGRLKEIIVLANGEKMPPCDMEDAIADDPLVEQVMVLGDSRPFLTALVVLNASEARAQGISEAPDEVEIRTKILPRITACLADFPGYAKIHRAAVVHEAWTVENGLLTPTLKLRRPRIMERYKVVIDKLYEGH